MNLTDGVTVIRPDVIVIDDDESMCEGCRQTLEEEGLRAAVARDGLQGLKLVEQSHPKVVLVDLKMPGLTGQEVIARISEIDPSIVSIVITGYGSIDTAVETMKIGAFDFLTKPFEPNKLLESVKRGLQVRQIHEMPSAEEIIPAAEVPGPAPMNKQDLLLKGLENLGEFYALGVGKRDFFDELEHLENEARFHAESLGHIHEREKAIQEMVRDLRIVDEVIHRHEYKKSALIQILLDIQAKINWLPRHALKWVSMRLNIPLNSIYTIANFYEAFSLKPRGAHIIQVCDGTACHVRGSSELLERVSNLLGISPGETDSEKLFTLQSVHCLGCCALAPVIKIDDQYFNNPKVIQLQKVFDSYREKRELSCQN
ncbi:NAD(P)H-dependent oxidoreductase subunit E [bacterium]|nr:NAD(P)H-dependent oxidoreductase subunit E [bacterium]